uniref:GrpE protein homolog n=1 Tax=Wollemia nobilis TaxID=56998 RepID=A0A0C9RGR7_9CONI
MAATSVTGVAFHVPQSGLVSHQNKFKLYSHLNFPVKISCGARLSRVGFASLNPVNRRRSTFFVTQKVAETESTEAEEESDEELEESDAGDSKNASTEQKTSVLPTLLQAYKEAFANGDDAKLAEIEAQLQVIEDEKNALSHQISTLTAELSTGKERFLRLNADFDNFRKRADKERLTLASNIQGEVIESLLPMVDNFERAKSQIKTQTEGEEKIDKSYQGIYKQFVEIMKSLRVMVVETVGKPFDPMLHEAIMREESTSFEEGIIIQEFRRGFILEDRLLRPAMVKVSAGPGPAKTAEDSAKPAEDYAESGEEPKEMMESSTSDDP